MTAEEVLAALQLPQAAHLSQRIPKKLLVEHGAPTATDKRRINEGIEEMRWCAVLKPSTIGVPAYRDEQREYLEIAVLTLRLRPQARAARLAHLTHRAIPYPVFLIVAQHSSVTISLAHKRWSLGETGATVLDGGAVEAVIPLDDPEPFEPTFLEALALASQPRSNLRDLYDGWVETVEALLSARFTGTFGPAESAQHIDSRRQALNELAQLDTEIARVRSAAAKERQIARQVDLNLQLKCLEARRATMLDQL